MAVEFSKRYKVTGFDLNHERIFELTKGIDRTLEVESSELSQATSLRFTSDVSDLRQCNCFIVTVPTPIDGHNNPDLSALKIASSTIGGLLKPGDTVIYESTVYPGCTEEECVPILIEVSGLEFNADFFVGYSPERINPGDKSHRVADIVKVTSGSNREAANFVNDLYASIITAGTHQAPSIMVAEAAKVIENTQRDVNIALINELSLIFNKMNIDTEAVLKAAGTKWNFLPFLPGLVGGHCIGVDPYYLTYKSESIGYRPEVILAGRRVNDGMGRYVGSQLIKLLNKRGPLTRTPKVLIMGFSFKENCPDFRNTKVVDIYQELIDYGCMVEIYDPWVNALDAQKEYGVHLLNDLTDGNYDAIIVAVAHHQFIGMGAHRIRSLGSPNHILYDLKHIFSQSESDIRL